MSSNQFKFLAAFLGAVGFIASNAQGVLTTPKGSTIRVIRSSPVIGLMSLGTEDQPVKGSPYLKDEFSDGTVFLQSGDQYKAKIRYNIFEDQLEFRERDSIFLIGPDPIIKKVVLGPQALVIDSYAARGRSMPSYYSLIDSGKLTMLTKMSIVFKEAEVRAIEGAVPAEYERAKDEYYFKVGNGSPTKIRSISKIIEELPDHKREMEEYAKKEKISGSKPKELAKFSQYYNSLK